MLYVTLVSMVDIPPADAGRHAARGGGRPIERLLALAVALVAAAAAGVLIFA